MSGAQAENWFRELIRDKITVSAQAKGDYLAGMFMSGDEEAGIYKFPVIGRLEATPISGSIQKVNASDAAMSTIEVRPEDYEASAWYRTQDLYKMGPSHQQKLADLISMAIARQKDKIKWDALYAFKPGAVDVGGDTTILDTRYVSMARGKIAGAGMVSGPGDVFMPLPERAMDQLAQDPLFSSKDYVAPDDAPFSKTARMTMRQCRGVVLFTMPDENFTWENGSWDSDTNWFETFMWSKEAFAAETPWNQQAPSITQHHDYEGSPYLIKSGVGGCAVGIQQVGVQKLRFEGNRLPQKYVQRTETVT